MDPFGAFKSEVFRPIASLVLPGMLAIGMFAIILGNSVPEVRNLYSAQPILYFALFFSAATIAGMLLENIGSSLERGIDTCMEREYLPNSGKVWGAYLACECKESYARKYLGALVTRLKFINSMIPASAAFGFGLILLNLQITRWPWHSIGLFEIVLLLLSTWLYKSSVELSEAALFSRLRILPEGHGINLDVDAHTVSRFRHFAYSLTELRTARIEEIDFSGLTGFRLFVELFRLMLPFTSKVSDATRATP